MLTDFLRERWTAVYVLGTLGALLQISGGYWDVSWHILGLVETFVTPPHAILYSGIGIALAASAAGVALRDTVFRADPVRRPLLDGLRISLVGGIFQAIAGPADFLWHEAYGFDPFLFTPPHALLILGIVLVGVGIAIGTLRLLEASRDGSGLGRFPATPNVLGGLALTSLTVLWLDLNILVYLLTNVEGIAYTFHLGDAFVPRAGPIAFLAGSAALAFTGTLVLLIARRVLPGIRGTVGVAALAVAVSVLSSLAFRAYVLRDTAEGAALAWFLPLYVSFLIPVVLFIVGTTSGLSRARMLATCALFGPFASFLDGWSASFLWTETPEWVPLHVVFMTLGGLAAAGASERFSVALLARRTRATSPSL